MAGKPWTKWEIQRLGELERRKITLYQLWQELRRKGWSRTLTATDHKARLLIREGSLSPKKTGPELGGKVGYLDIETTDLVAEFGFMLSWAIKERDKKTIHRDLITKEEIYGFQFDKRIVKSLIRTLKRFDAVVTYNGTNFDLPFVRTRAVQQGVDFPGYAELNHFDLYFLAKSKMRLRSKKLAWVCQVLGIEGKTPLDPETWQMAMYGDPNALRYVLKHNLADVKITEEAHKRLERFSKGVLRTV